MKKSDLNEGEIYIYDKDNHFNQLELGIKLVKLVKKPKIFSNICKVVPLKRDGKEANIVLNVEANELSNFDTENLNNNVVVRYPQDIPSFSSLDFIALKTLLIYLREDESLQAKLGDQEILALRTMLDKVEFYAQLSSDNSPIHIEGEDEDEGG